MDSKVTQLPDLRGAVRVDVRLEAEAISDWGEFLRAEITNLSQTGLRLEGTMDLVGMVMPNWCLIPSSGRLATQVRFRVGDGGSVPEDDEPIIVRCQSVYVRRLDWNRFQVGMQYREIDELSEKRLERYIKTLLIRRTVYPRP